MHLHAVVYILVTQLATQTLRERGKRVGQFGIVLLLLAFLRSELSLLADILKSLIDVYVA